MRNRKGQAAVEYLSIVAFSLLVLVPIWLFVSNMNADVQDDLNIGYAKQAIKHIGESVDLVYSQGSPAQLVVDVRVPSNVDGVAISGNEVSVRVQKRVGFSDVFYTSSSNLTGNLDSVFATPGVKRVLIKAVPFGSYTVVDLSED